MKDFTIEDDDQRMDWNGKSAAPWHKASFDRFIQERLPRLLAERLPLAGYRVEPNGDDARSIYVSLEPSEDGIEVAYEGIPAPDERGVFRVDNHLRVVWPVASSENLETSEISCVGERLHDAIAERLGEAPADLIWNESLIRRWLPLDAWIREFLKADGQVFRPLNRLDAVSILRRLEIPNGSGEIAPGQIGRVCPIETTEGPKIGRALSVALGAEIRDGRLVILDDRPEAALGAAASMIPLLERSDTCRLLMGANMMRQWIVPPDPEPALVRTGLEPDASGVWCGRNLLTAYVCWGGDTFEDSIVLSRSCADRLGYPSPIEPGDKLSNRHGTKGIVSRILPDEEMPHLPDGSPIEIVVSFISLHTRMNFGQIREAVLGRIARAEGRSIIAPPFQSPSEAEIRERLARAGLSESGMETLTDGRDGSRLDRPSCIGWVYWGRVNQLAATQLYDGANPERCQTQGYLEYFDLRDAGAYENAGEQFNARALERKDSATLSSRVAAGRVTSAEFPSPRWAEVARRLAIGGIVAEFANDRLSFRFAAPGEERPDLASVNDASSRHADHEAMTASAETDGGALRLARPTPHPWSPDRELTVVGSMPRMREYEALAQTNGRIERMLEGRVPSSLIERVAADLETRTRAYFDALLSPHHLRFRARVLFSGRAVASPDADLRLDQTGLPEEMAWGLFGPRLIREMGGETEVRARSDRASRVLDDLMARSWVLLNRTPSIATTSLVAFHPIRRSGKVIRIHPLVCRWMNADFDGDVLAAYLPVTESAQREAGERLSVVGHATRDPGLLDALAPCQDSLWGLARLSLTPEGRARIAETAGVTISALDGYVSRQTFTEAMRRLRDRDGLEAALAAMERLMTLGFKAAKASGASMNPFFGETLRRPIAPSTDDPDAWDAYSEDLANRVAAFADYDDEDAGPQILAIKSGARGTMRQIIGLLGGFCITDIAGDRVPSRNGFVKGMTAGETFTHVIGMRRGLVAINREWARIPNSILEEKRSKGFGVLARAMRARRPGAVFAQAAATGETDPLSDLDSRLFAGLPPL